MILDEFEDFSNPSMDLDRQCLLCLHFEILINFIWVDDMVGISDTKETNDKFVKKVSSKVKTKRH